MLEACHGQVWEGRQRDVPSGAGRPPARWVKPGLWQGGSPGAGPAPDHGQGGRCRGEGGRGTVATCCWPCARWGLTGPAAVRSPPWAVSALPRCPPTSLGFLASSTLSSVAAPGRARHPPRPGETPAWVLEVSCPQRVGDGDRATGAGGGCLVVHFRGAGEQMLPSGVLKRAGPRALPSSYLLGPVV